MDIVAHPDIGVRGVALIAVKHGGREQAVRQGSKSKSSHSFEERRERPNFLQGVAGPDHGLDLLAVNEGQAVSSQDMDRTSRGAL